MPVVSAFYIVSFVSTVVRAPADGAVTRAGSVFKSPGAAAAGAYKARSAQRERAHLGRAAGRPSRPPHLGQLTLRHSLRQRSPMSTTSPESSPTTAHGRRCEASAAAAAGRGGGRRERTLLLHVEYACSCHLTGAASAALWADSLTGIGRQPPPTTQHQASHAGGRQQTTDSAPYTAAALLPPVAPANSRSKLS